MRVKMSILPRALSAPPGIRIKIRISGKRKTAEALGPAALLN